MKVVIFKNVDNKFAVIMPTQEALQFATIEQIAEKDVPAGRPYWIVDASLLPADIPVEAIYIDENANPPHGFGGESNEFPPDVIQKYKEMSK